MEPVSLALLIWVAATIDWTAITVGIVSGLFGTLTVAGGIWAARRQFSGSAGTATGDGMLGFSEALMKLQQDSLTKAHERCAVLESKVERLETELAAERTLRQQAELENARLKAERA